MPNGFPIDNYNIFLYAYGPKWDKCILLPCKISLLLLQYGILSGWQDALGLAYIDVGEVRKT